MTGIDYASYLRCTSYDEYTLGLLFSLYPRIVVGVGSGLAGRWGTRETLRVLVEIPSDSCPDEGSKIYRPSVRER